MAADLPAVPEFERLCSLVRDGGVGLQVTGGTVTTVRQRAAQALMIVSTYFRLLRHIVSRAWVRSWVSRMPSLPVGGLREWPKRSGMRLAAAPGPKHAVSSLSWRP